MKNVWGVHVGTSQEEEQSEECICEPPQACLYYSRPSETVETDPHYAYEGLKDPAKGADPLEDHLSAFL